MGGDKVLFSGDLLFSGQFPWAGDPSADPHSWIGGRAPRRDVDTIVPGHGLLCDKREVEKQLLFFKAMRKEMKHLISKGASEEDALRYEGYPEFYPPGRPQWRGDSLRHWYRVWKGRR